jgi:outer membrane protein assembly complex protein YaeT
MTLQLYIATVPSALGQAAPSPRTGDAEIEISGYGILGNRELQKTLNLLQPGDEPPYYYDAAFIEDASLLLLSSLRDDGYLRPALTVTLTLYDGSEVGYVPDRQLSQLLPRPLMVRRAHFVIRKGLLHHYRNIEFTGLESLTLREARGFFLETDTLVALKSMRVYTPNRLERSLGNLRETLARMGFNDATITVSDLRQDDKTGGVDLHLAVDEGTRTLVRSVRKEIYEPGSSEPARIVESTLNQPYSTYWEQSFRQELRAEQYRRGHPDADATLTLVNRDALDGTSHIDLLARVETGLRVEVGEVRFHGNERTRNSILDRRVKLDPGDPLNRIEAERSRQRIARLGVFRSVGLRYDPVEGETRDVIYDLEEGRAMNLSLLMGYGSYELLRGGFELEYYNLWGRAHHSRLRVIQSFKASSADYLYTMPELLGEDIHVFVNASGLRREEVSFVREEYGGAVGAQRYFRPIDSDVGLRYVQQFLNAADNEATLPGEQERVRVGAFVLDLKHDRRDNPLVPRRGFKFFSNVEFASDALGGEVDYQRLELAASQHFPLGGGRYIHFGVSYGAAFTQGDSDTELPFNKRFFPGGENSVRGYQQGEASPLDADGNVLGAETYLQANLEFEQALTPAWSVVAFVDGVGMARRTGDSPLDETLYSAGGGLRWKTIIGPARLEYGHNLNPRRHDPSGTLHFSIGFPF